MHELLLLMSMYLGFGFLFTIWCLSELQGNGVYDPVRKYGFRVALSILFWPFLVMLAISKLVDTGAYRD